MTIHNIQNLNAQKANNHLGALNQPMGRNINKKTLDLGSSYN
jgi:hypothetical protein